MGFLMTETIMSKEVIQQATEGQTLDVSKAGLDYNTKILAQ